MDLKTTPATLGAVLKMDPKTERFIGNPEADKLLTREYPAAVCGPGQGLSRWLGN